MARGQRISPAHVQRRGARPLARLNETRRILHEAHQRLTAGSARDIDVGPAGEWLLDNFHVVQEHIQEVAESLPRGYYRELPELARGPLTGYPRVYELAISLISHTEGRIDLENVDLFIRAFQEVSSLTIGELWAVPAMLRLGLIENVRRVALRTVQRLDEVEEADRWAARLQAANEEGPTALTEALNDFVAAPHPLTPTFVSRFLHQLRLATGAAPVLLWLEQWIAEEGVSFDDAATRSTQRLARTQITMANSITSLRAIARLDWRTLVERESAMEAVLRSDPSGFYSQMTFEIRDQYRHVVERIAKRTHKGETAVAHSAIELAAAGASEEGGDPRRAHVGYYLVDEGLAVLERTTGYRATLSEALLRMVIRHPNVVLVGGIVSGTAVALAALLWLAGPAAIPAWLPVLLFSFIPANDIAVNLTNQLVTAFLPPHRLPRLDLSDGGIPPQYCTAVVVPTLFGSVEAVRDALDNLEVQFLANRRGAVHFAVLSDFTDSPTETRKTDTAILSAAVAGVQALNGRYADGRQDLFYLFHRPRLWNPQQGVWMGWERKRGKLAQFNRFVRDGRDDGFSTIVGNREPLRQVRYVITLDADTKLPPDAAAALVGTIAHPLNRAVYDPILGRVVRGYGILQPRVGVSLPSAHRSRFAAIQSGHPGVDPYTTAVSDVYQDLYGEGSFTGKGIYEVETFEQATHGRFPENRLLSHDLIEGNYARAGLVTDITVYDDYPTRYLTYTRRKHRWIRGDWQLLQWLTTRVPGPDGPERNRLSLLSRWKLLDNLRRSTVEIAQLLFFVAGWTLLPGSPLRWTALGLGAIAMPWLAALLLALIQPPLDKSWRAYYEAVGQDARTSVQQIALAITFLPHQAWVSADAILRTLGRLFITRRSLLEWQTASQTERVLSGAGLEVWRTMWPTVVVVGLIFLLTAALELLSNAGIFCASCLLGASPGVSVNRIWQLAFTISPLCALWLVSPAIAQSLSAPAIRRERRLAPTVRVRAMRYALLHWRFFDRFVTAETNWLAPDNFQETPVPVTAMRTSPTNAGLQLLATVSAYELGLITVADMTRRLELAFESLSRLSRFRGHFFNWYDLRNLQLLEPAYISTVDSGNLAGHLIAFAQACLAIRDDPPFDARLWRAVDAALGLANERLRIVAASEGADAPETSRALVKISDLLLSTRAHVTTLVAQSGSRAPDRKPERGAAESDGPMEALTALVRSLREMQDAIRRPALAPTTVEPLTEWIDWSVRLVEEHRSRPVNQLNSGKATLRGLASSSPAVAELMGRLEALASRAHGMAMEMDFTFLFDETRELFAIGYQTGTHSLDPSYYDLLASEARLASFIAIAKNDAPVEHWFRLGRTLTHAAGETALVSWSGSMFEYLMPVLVMQSFPFTVLNQTYRAALQRQIAYGTERGVPWGISESAYNVRDRHLTYQYRAFGVPDLALKRGLSRDLVIAPYASALAVMVDPQKALANLGTLEKKGALGPYGFRDALDYTRPRPGERYALVETYMAHHVGMSFVALTNALLAKLWQRRFHADPMVRSAELLLHERVPRRLALQEPIAGPPDEARVDDELSRPAVREVDSPDTPQPRVALLGHLPYTIMVSHCGGGYSRYQELAVTRWRADGTRDHTGQFCYLKDVSRGRVWSASHQPLCVPADWYRAVLATDRVTFHRADGSIETRTEIAVVPEDSAEVRRVTVTNNGSEHREIEVTSYGEIVLATPDSDRAHPAFSNLFVETEWHEWCTAITATRRPRSANDPSLFCVHVVDTGKERIGSVTCETDRARFLGRGRSPREPIVLERDGSLSGTTGAVLDPIFALRTRVRVAPGQSASVAFTTLVAATRDRAFELAGRYHDPHAVQRAFDLAWTSAQIELRELGITPADSAVFQEIAGHLFYSSQDMRAPEEEIRRNRGSQPRLWANGLSGDWPIILVTIDSVEGLATLRQVFAAHRYWRRRGMVVDLFILNAHPHTYLQELNDRILEAMFASGDPGLLDRPGGVFIRPRDLVAAEDLLMISATARVQIPCDGRSLGRIVDSLRPSEDEGSDDGSYPSPAPRLSERSAAAAESMVQRFRSHASSVIAPFTSLPWPTRQTAKPGRPPSGPAPVSFDNGFGGLAANGDYQIRVRGDRVPPTPWVNVIANARGGFVVSERGTGFTWAENSFFFRLTPWHNDPVTDPASEGLYLHDLESGELWSAAPAPVSSDGEYTIHHGPGSSSFEHDHGGIASTLTLGIADAEAVKLSLLRITNRSTGRRRLSITAYVEWTLGALREHTQHQVHTEFSAERKAILARNHFDQQFAGWVAFLAASESITGYTADRREFLGRNGSTRDPAGLHGPALSGSTGAGIDPCAVLQWELELAPGESREMVVLLGAAAGESEARRAIDSYRDVPRAKAALARSVAEWSDRLSVISVRTPEPTFDVMLNRWTLYQALACRIWARSAVYQSSGAYGFRDQLQDVMALVYAEPGMARQHIVRAAARQFVEGDVQHWWHPQTGRGVRTRFSDDLVWLPYVVEHYVRVTGDAGILDESVSFLAMRPLEPNEHEVYDLPRVSSEKGSVYEHCLRALRKACTTGEHGLPLIGGGDWNDGMNRVGVEGRGESVWLAWFLVTTLRAFAERAEARDDHPVASEFRSQATAYAAATEAQGWDGDWYRRAFFDDGTALGSAANEECRIDSIAQSWSVISGAGDPTRQPQAMRALEQYLVREDARLIMLLTPPFDRTEHDPGYIKGYLPGVRENGSQYTHAALWAVLATALRGDGNRAFELYQMINPLTHTRTPEEVQTYKAEPYVVAADVYTARGHIGRGGWTWYTGSASWMYRVGVESILGFQKRGESLTIAPRVPPGWSEYTINYRHGRSEYEIVVRNPGAIAAGRVAITLDGQLLTGSAIPLVDDGARHRVIVSG